MAAAAPPARSNPVRTSLHLFPSALVSADLPPPDHYGVFLSYSHCDEFDTPFAQKLADCLDAQARARPISPNLDRALLISDHLACDLATASSPRPRP